MTIRVPLAQGVAAQLTNVTDPTQPQDTATKNYVDTRGPGGATALQNLTDVAVVEPLFTQVSTFTVTAIAANIQSITLSASPAGLISVGDWLRGSATLPGQLPALQVIFISGNSLQFSIDPSAYFAIGNFVYRLPNSLEGSALFFSNAANKWIAEAPNNTLPLDTLDWVDSLGDLYVTDTTFAVFDSPVTTNVSNLSSPWTFPTPTLPFTNNTEIVGVDTFGRMTTGKYVNSTSSGTATAILENVLVDRRGGGGFGFNQAYTLSWRQGKPANTVNTLNALKGNVVLGSSDLSVIITPDAATNRINFTTTGGGGSTVITSPNSTIVVGGTTAAATIDVAIPAEKLRIDGEITSIIGSVPTQYTNSGTTTVSTGFGNVGTTANVISGGFSTLKAFLQTAAIGAIPIPSGLGDWTLPTGWTIKISNIANPTATQLGLVDRITENTTNSLLQVHFVGGNQTYFANAGATAQPLFFFGNPGFNFQPLPLAGIDTEVRKVQVVPTVGATTLTDNYSLRGDTTSFYTRKIVAGSNTYWDTDAAGSPRINATLPISAGLGWIVSMQINWGFNVDPPIWQGNNAFPVFLNDGTVTTRTGVNSTTYLGNLTDIDWDINASRRDTQKFGDIYCRWHNSFADALTATAFVEDIYDVSIQTTAPGPGITPTQSDAVVQGLFNIANSSSPGQAAAAIAFSGSAYTYQRAKGGAAVITPTWQAVMTQGNSINATSGVTPIILRDNQATPNQITLETPAIITTSYSLTLPFSQGAANTTLLNDGSGTLSWATDSTAVPDLLQVTTVGSTTTTTMGIGGALTVGYTEANTSNVMVLAGGAAGTTPSITASGIDTAIGLKLIPKGSGNITIGTASTGVGTNTYAGVTISGGNTTYTEIKADGSTSSIDLVLAPKGAGDLYPIGVVLSSATNTRPKIYVATGQGLRTLGSGDPGQVLTSDGNSSTSGSPYWASGSSLTGYFDGVLTTGTVSGDTLINFVTNQSLLPTNVTYSGGTFTNGTSAGIYVSVIYQLVLTTTGAVPVESDMWINSTNINGVGTTRYSQTYWNAASWNAASNGQILRSISAAFFVPSAGSFSAYSYTSSTASLTSSFGGQTTRIQVVFIK